jgi:hypothetical protein
MNTDPKFPEYIPLKNAALQGLFDTFGVEIAKEYKEIFGDRKVTEEELEAYLSTVIDGLAQKVFEHLMNRNK